MKEGYEHQIDCMYGAASALYLLEDYDKARVSRSLRGVVFSHILFSFVFFAIQKERCESILRSNPESRLAMELHLASIEAKEQRDAKKMKDAAIGSAVAMGALGVVGAVASVLLTKR